MIIPESKLKKNLIRKLEEIVGPRGYSLRDTDRFNYSRDSNFKSTIRAQYNQLDPLPDLITWPTQVEQVQKLVHFAIRHKIPIIPYGGGSGVAGGTLALTGGMIIDLKRMSRLVELDEANLQVTVEPGLMGLTFEEELQRRGYTLGHFPSSILCASVGGYLAARSAGQLSSRYGKIEDMVRRLQVVTGTGEIIETQNMSFQEGEDLNSVFVGSEGTLGLITQATFQIYPYPKHRLFRGIKFKSMKVAMEAIRRMMQTGIKPAVVRLYDELDTLLLLSYKFESGKGSLPIPFFAKRILRTVQDAITSQSYRILLSMPHLIHQLTQVLPVGCLVIFMNEGEEKLIQAEQKTILSIASELGGDDLGEEPGLHWYKKRYHVSYKTSPLFWAGAFTDTIEVAGTWDQLHNLYMAMLKAISPHAFIMAHLSHVYTDGGSLYFTFVAPLKGPKKSEELFNFIWDKALSACQKEGGIISHHHGIGRLKAKFMETEWGHGVEIFKQFKKRFDPHGLMNPGKLFLEPAMAGKAGKH